MRIAFIISAYQEPQMLIRLVNRLQAPDHGFFIHYDLRSDESEFRSVADGLGGMANVKLLERHRCYWGGFGHVLATLKGIREIAKFDFVYDYAILLTAQDYPIKSDVEIRRRLEAAGGRSYMEWSAWPAPNWQDGCEIRRVRNIHIHLPFPRWARRFGWPVSKQHISIPMRRAIPGGLRPHFGSSYWYLHRDCLRHIQAYVAENPSYARFFQWVHIPDECFFQTLLLNSALAPRIEPRTLTFVKWRPPWPGILTTQDLSEMRGADCLLARKFDLSVDHEVLDRLDSGQL